MEKTCSVCLISKGLSCFGKQKQGKLGVRAMCKPCYNTANKNWNRIRLYNIGQEQYNNMVQKCGGLCEICGNKQKRGEDLCVDHDHRTLKIRGLLCKGCNLGLGKLGDSKEGILKVIEYLKRPLTIKIEQSEKNKTAMNLGAAARPKLIYKDNKPIGRFCSVCNISKDFSHFNRFKWGFMGYAAACKKCRSIAKFSDKLKSLYKMNVSQYNNLYSFKDGRCWICNHKSNRELCIDHDHVAPYRIRGLLCHDCNMGVGKLGDTLQCLEKVLKYLENTQDLKG